MAPAENGQFFWSWTLWFATKTLKYFSHFPEKAGKNPGTEFVCFSDELFRYEILLRGKKCICVSCWPTGQRGGGESCDRKRGGVVFKCPARAIDITDSVLSPCSREKFKTNIKSTHLAFLAWAAKENVSKRKNDDYLYSDAFGPLVVGQNVLRQ